MDGFDNKGKLLREGKVCVSDRFGQHSQGHEDSAILVPTNFLVLADGAKNISFRANGRGYDGGIGQNGITVDWQNG